MAITPLWIARLRSILVQSLTTAQLVYTNVQGQRSNVKVTGSKVNVTA